MATKVGCCINMLCRLTDDDLKHYINNLCQMGFDYIELPLKQIMEFSDTEFVDFKNDLEKYPIDYAVCNDFVPEHLKVTGSDVDMEALLGYLESSLSRADEIGVQKIVFGSGGARYVPKGFSMQSAFKQLVVFLREVSTKASRFGISVAIEHLNKEECNIINTIAEAAELCAAVEADNICVLADYYHLYKENERVEIMSAENDIPLIHAHIADPRQGRAYPTNFHAHVEFLDKVKERGIETISVEGYTDNFVADASASLKMLKSVLV